MAEYRAERAKEVRGREKPDVKPTQYIPPEKNVISVLEVATTDENVFLPAPLDTGDRKSEIFSMAPAKERKRDVSFPSFG